MCDKESFARLRDQTEANTKQIGQLAISDAAQSEQIKTLFNATKEQGQNQQMLLNRLVMAIVLILIMAFLAVIYGALGEKGFNAVQSAALDTAQIVLPATTNN